MRKIIVKDGLLWEGSAKDIDNVLTTYEADRIAQANGFPYVESLIRKYRDGAVMHIDNESKILDIN